MRTIKGIGLLLVGIFALFLAHGVKKQATAESESFLLFLVVPVFGLTTWLARRVIRRSRKHMSPYASELVSRDGRRPILLLRSFQDDDRIIVGNSIWNPFNLLIGRGRSFEEVLAAILNRYGPLIAIGRPGETAPPVGAARMYVPQDHWQAEVLQLIDSSRLVVVQLGNTNGLAWELEQLVRMGKMDKVVIALPPLATDELWLRWQVFSDMLEDKTSMQFSGFPPADALFAYLGSSATFRFLRLPSFSRGFLARTFRNQGRSYSRALELLLRVSATEEADDERRISNAVSTRGAMKPPTVQGDTRCAMKIPSLHTERLILADQSAPIVRRVAATIVDYLLLGLLLMCLGAIMSASRPSGTRTHVTGSGSANDLVGIVEAESESESMANDSVNFTVVGFWMVLLSVSEWLTGYSPGKYLMRIRVVDLFGNRMYLTRALCRNLLKYMLFFVAPLSLLYMQTQKLRQSVHDLLASTVVVETRLN